MSFVSNIFIFYFLPISVFLTTIAKKISNTIYKIVLFILSYIFCFWLGRKTLVFVFVISILVYLSQFIKKQRSLIIVFIILLILFFNYFSIYYKGSNRVILGMISLEPIAISFVGLSAISFVADISKKETTYSVSFIDSSLYISYFPKYISGPIAKWSKFSNSLSNSHISLDRTIDGIISFIKGFAYKSIIADTLLYSIQPIINNYSNYNSILLILCIFTYSFVIYFDFLGYSKMACGVSKMLGIDLPNNFNMPYKSKSISEFYRRWHISLGDFFKEYVYIPLGGNRKNVYLNILIVMFLSGIWHGNGIAYIVWGLINGLIMIIERKKKINLGTIGIIINFVIVSILWTPFMLNSASSILSYFVSVFKNINVVSIYNICYYYNLRTVIILLIAIILSFVNLESFGINIREKSPVLYYFAYALLFIVCIMFMINSSYSPFIYFRF